MSMIVNDVYTSSIVLGFLVILNNLNMLSVNQINAQVKLTEIWKSSNITDYPIVSVKQEEKEGTRCTRAKTRGDVIQTASSQLSQATFLNDAFKIWNKAPLKIKTCNSLFSAKKEIRKYVKTLPL